MPWATSAQVEEITGVAVTQAVVDQAHTLIELLVDRTEEAVGTEAALGNASDYTGRGNDLRRLRLAVAFQAAAMTSGTVRPLGATAGLYQLSQPDLTVTFSPGGDPLTQAYHPLALKAARQLTWRRNRSVPIHSGPTRSAFDNEDEDLTAERARSPWIPLGGT